MAVSSNLPISASFYNSLQSTVANVLGVGSGNKGYGQTVTSSQVTKPVVTSAQWNALMADVNKCYKHQNGGVDPLASLLGVMTSSDVNNYETYVNSINANSLTANSANMTLTTGALTLTRTGTWSTNIVAVATVTFSDANSARYFFNSGGELRMQLSHPSTATPQDTSWSTILGNIGTIALKATSTTRTGTLGVASSSTGYYSLTSLDNVIYNGTDIGSGAYVSNDAIIAARISGANTIIFTITLQDQHTNSFYDSVATGTTATFSYLRSTVYMTGIPSPTFTATQQFL